MELKKRSENYTISDLLESGWVVNGDVTVELNDSTRINISINKEQTYIGNYNYILYKENNHVQVHYDMSGGSEEDVFVNYCESLVDQILNQLQSELDN